MYNMLLFHSELSIVNTSTHLLLSTTIVINVPLISTDMYSYQLTLNHIIPGLQKSLEYFEPSSS